MDNMMYILFICLVIPLMMMTFLVDKKSKRAVVFFIIGVCCAVFASEVNALIATVLPLNIEEITIRVTPITEEIIKAIPVLFFARVISDKKENVVTVALAVGIGFAVMENYFILMQSVSTVSIIWALMRGFGTSIMHGMCTMLLGLGFSFVNKSRKLFVVGTFALFALAITYHASFNMLVQSDLRYIGTLLPLITYLPFLIIQIKNSKKGGQKK